LEEHAILELSTIFKSLSDKTRFQIVMRLLKRSYCVGGLARTLNVSEAAISQHIKILKEANLIEGEKSGYFMHYKVKRDVLENVAQALLNLAAIELLLDKKCQQADLAPCKLCNRA